MMKKLLSLLLAGITIMSLATPAYANFHRFAFDCVEFRTELPLHSIQDDLNKEKAYNTDDPRLLRDPSGTMAYDAGLFFDRGIAEDGQTILPLFSQSSYEMARYFNSLGRLDAEGEYYNLGRKVSEAEAIASLVRMLGEEENALNGNYSMPYSNVPAQYSKYIAYAYNKGYIDDTFSPNKMMGMRKYIAICLKTMGFVEGQDFPKSDPRRLASKVGIINQPDWNDKADINKQWMIGLAYNTLAAKDFKDLRNGHKIQGYVMTKDIRTNMILGSNGIWDYRIYDTIQRGIFLKDPKFKLTSEDLSYGKESVISGFLDAYGSTGSAYLYTKGDYMVYSSRMRMESDIYEGHPIKLSMSMEKAAKNNNGDNIETLTTFFNAVYYLTGDLEFSRNLYGLIMERYLLQDLGGVIPSDMANKYGFTVKSEIEDERDMIYSTISSRGKTYKMRYSYQPDYYQIEFNF